MTRRFAISSVLAIGALALSVSAAPRFQPLEHFSAKAVEMTSLARVHLRVVDIAVTRWSTYAEHQMLQTALLQKGPVTFVDALCNLTPAGSIATMDGRDFIVRYAWQVADRDGGRRIFLATDEPITLANSTYRTYPSGDPEVFVELRLDRYGNGEGKLSEASRLSVDQSRGLIELRDYDARPLQLMGVRSVPPFEY